MKKIVLIVLILICVSVAGCSQNMTPVTNPLDDNCKNQCNLDEDWHLAPGCTCPTPTQTMSSMP